MSFVFSLVLKVCPTLIGPEHGNPYHALHFKYFSFKIASGGELGYVTVDGALEVEPCL